MRAQNEEVKEELAKAKADVKDILAVTVNRIDDTVSKAQAQIGQDVNEVRNKVDEYKSSTQDQVRRACARLGLGLGLPIFLTS